MLAPPWCAPVYARMRGIRRIIESPLRARHARPARRARALAERLRSERLRARDRAAELVEVGARALARAHSAARTGYVGEVALRPAERRAPARPQGAAAARRPLRRAGGAAGRARADAARAGAGARSREPRRGRCARCACRRDRPVVDPVSRRRVRAGEALAADALRRARARASSRDGLQVWLVGSPNDKLAADVGAAGRRRERGARSATSPARTDLGTAIDLLSLAVGRRVATTPA